MRRFATPCLLFAVMGTTAATAAPQLASDMLAGLQRGQWTITPRDGGAARSICLRDPAQLVQLRHPRGKCSRYVVENAADRTTVQYTCRGSGYGRTSIRRETATLVQIESQGIAGGQPFQLQAEARRTGACR